MLMDIKIKIGSRIRDLRQQKSISQNDLAYYAKLDLEKLSIMGLIVEKIH